MDTVQSTLFPEAPSEQKKPTNLLSNRHPIHRWANFIAGYSPELVSSAITGAGLPPESTILDPFSGLGTTLVQGLMEGLNVIGAEANPYFADMAHAKCLSIVSEFDYENVFDVLHNLSPARDEAIAAYSPDAIKFLNKLFPEESLRILVNARNHEDRIQERSRPLFRLVVSCLLEDLSSSQTDGVYKAPSTNKRAKSYEESLRNVEAMIRTDLNLPKPRSVGRVLLHKGSALDLNPSALGNADLCVTSPPYLNNFDYAEMSRMELYFWGYASSWGEITERIRSIQVPNTTTIPTTTKRAHLEYRPVLSTAVADLLDPIVANLDLARRERGGSKDYHSLVYPYFATLQRIFQNCHSILRKGSPIHIIIGDAYLYGIHIPTGEVLHRILLELGFDELEKNLLRTRGTRWILAKRQGAGTPIGEFSIYGKRA